MKDIMNEYNTYIEEILNLSEKEKIVGEIYKITNIATGKVYIGQTLSHHKNHNKYRPYGFICRFRCHISTAHRNTKKSTCTYLYNAIRRYGNENFKIELLLRCDVVNLDYWEIEKIKEFNSIYPNGYNLTKGGKSARCADVKNDDCLNEKYKRGGCVERTDKTRKIISERLKAHLTDINVLKAKSVKTSQQHIQKKFELFKNVVIDPTDLNKYLYVIHESKNDLHYVRVKVDKARVNFYSKHESLSILRERAYNFLLELVKIKATSSNCSGNP